MVLVGWRNRSSLIWAEWVVWRNVIYFKTFGVIKDKQSRVKVGSSRMANVNVTLEEIYSKLKNIEIMNTRCEDCNGIGGKIKLLVVFVMVKVVY